MTTLRKIPIGEYETDDSSIVDVVNRSIDEIQRLTVGGTSDVKQVVLTNGVALSVKTPNLKQPVTNVIISNYRPVLPIPNNFDIEDYRIHDFNFVIENLQTVKVKAFWNNPDTFNKMNVRLRFTNDG